MHYLIIGAGPAGVTACETIRQLSADADITLITGHHEQPYSRMAIPYLLENKIEEQGTHLRQDKYHFVDLKIKVLYDSVQGVDSEAKTVKLNSNIELSYDKLLIATGASPVNPPIDGMDLPHVHNCWTLDDARLIAEKAKQGANVVLMGAGFIGCIILESLVVRGVNLSVVEMGDRMVPRMMDDNAGQMLRSWCESKGVAIYTGHQVDKILAGENQSLIVHLNNGDTLNADLVISATGVKSNTDFLSQSGISIDHGIVVNQYLESSQNDIFAAGDVAQGLNFSDNNWQVQAIQPTAVEHGRIAAHNMVKPESCPHLGSINMNVLDTMGLISTSFGLWMGVEGGDQAILCDNENYQYLNLQFDDDILVGMSSLGHTQHVGVARGLIRGRVKLGRYKGILMNDPTRIMEAYLACAQGQA